VKTAKGLSNIRRPDRTLQPGPKCCPWRLSANQAQRSVWGQLGLGHRDIGSAWLRLFVVFLSSFRHTWGRCLVSPTDNSFLIPFSSLFTNNPASSCYTYSVLLTASLNTRQTKEETNKQTNKHDRGLWISKNAKDGKRSAFEFSFPGNRPQILRKVTTSFGRETGSPTQFVCHRMNHNALVSDCSTAHGISCKLQWFKSAALFYASHNRR